ncbi:MAG: GAF domain-containing protein, partial [Chloroflexota bacterium]|nr:GAF domain-containing protein [Chloroflexota bacterium]
DVTACSVWLIEPETDELVCLQAATPRDEIVRGWRLAPGEGICGWVAHRGESLIIADAWADERYYSGVDEQTGLGLRSILTIPLRVKEDVIGVLQVLDTRADRFDETDLELLKPLVASAAIAIENAQLYEKARQRVAGLEALQRTSLQLISTLDLSAVLDTIAESSLTMTEATDCHIYLYDEASETLDFGAAFWENGRRKAAVQAPRRDGFTATVAREGQALVINDAYRHPLYATPEAQEWKLQAIAGFPLKRAGRVLGVFTIAFLTAHTFNEEELGILGLLADQAAIAIENARLYEEARRDAETRATLLCEVNHRVKNNLTAIIGLLHTERRHAKMKEQAAYQAIMQRLVGRVQGLATVHSMLSASEWKPLSLSELMVQVIHSSLHVLPRNKRVSVDVTPSPARVTSDQAHNLALVINELTTNSIKYGLQEQSAARIGVRIELDGNTVMFEFRDDGPGYPEEVLRLERSNVGFDLIQNIVRKSLHGELSLYNDGGAVAVIRFGDKT